MLAKFNLYLRATLAYYDMRTPLMDDAAYDALQEELQKNRILLTPWMQYIVGKDLKTDAHSIPSRLSSKAMGYYTNAFK